MMFRHLESAGCVVRAAIRGRVPYLILFVTSQCNARCRMCFNWDAMMERRGKQPISLENIRKLARSIQVLPQLTLSGGEPLLRDDVHDIVQAFYDDADTRFFTVPTNALSPKRVANLIDRFVLNCPKGFLNFCMPFHGTEESFDDIMGVPNSFEKFKKTYDIVTTAKKRHRNISCSLNFVMNKFNYMQYEQIIDLARSKFPEAPLGIAYARGITHEREATSFDVATYEAATEYLARRAGTKSRYNPYTIIFGAIAGQMSKTVAAVDRGKIADLNCRAGRSLLVVYDDGTVHPCEMLDVVGMPKGQDAPCSSCMGNLADFDYDLDALLKSDDAKRVVDWIRTHDCVCTWECAIYRTIIHTPTKLARLAIDTVKYLF